MQTHALARLRVAAQFGLLALMFAWPAPHWRPSGPALALPAAGAALVLWVFWHNRPGNFNIAPEPRQGAHLVTTGPYRRVRHPMYVALILFMAGVAAAAHSPVQWALWIALGVVLNFKVAMEERLLMSKRRAAPSFLIPLGGPDAIAAGLGALSSVWPDYIGHARITRRFIPGLW